MRIREKGRQGERGPHEDLQWFDRFVMTFPDGSPVAEVSVRRGGQAFNKTSSRVRGHRFWEQLAITLGAASEPMLHMKEDQMVGVED